MAELNVIAQHEDVEELPDVLLLVLLCTEGAPASVSLPAAVENTAWLPESASPVNELLEENFLRILPSSLSTRIFSCSLLEALRMSEMNTCQGNTAVSKL